MASRGFRIIGVVVDAASNRGIDGARVELVGGVGAEAFTTVQARTDADGRFEFAVEAAQLRRVRQRNFFFRVLIGRVEVLNTSREPLEDVTGAREVRLPVTVPVEPPVDPPTPPPPPPEPPAAEETGRDLLTTEKAIQVGAFFRDSEWGAMRSEGASRARTTRDMFGKLATSAIANYDWKPLKAPQTRSSQIVGQDVGAATGTLGGQGVIIAKHSVFEPHNAKQVLAMTRAQPHALKAGDKVEVFVDENQQVRGYALVREKAAADINAADVQALTQDVSALHAEVRGVDAVKADVESLKTSRREDRDQAASDVSALRAQLTEVDGLRRELEVLRRESADKDQRIESLRSQLSTVKVQQDQLERSVSPDRLARLEADVALLRRRPP